MHTTQAAHAASGTAAPTPFTLNLHQRRCLHQAQSQLVELYVEARDGKPLAQDHLAERLDAISRSLTPAVRVALGLLPNGRKPDPQADVRDEAPPGDDLAAAVQLTDHGIDAEEDACSLLMAALTSADPDDEISLPVGPLQRLLEGMCDTLHAARHRAERLRDAALNHLHPNARPQAVQP